MKKPPRDPNSGLVNRKFLTSVIMSGVVLGVSSIAIFWFEYSYLGNNLEYAQTSTFAFMAVAQLLHIFNVRKRSKFGLDKSLFDNKILIGALLASVVLLLIAVYVPFMNTILGTVPLAGLDWIYIAGLGVVSTFAVYLFRKVMNFGKN